MIIPTVMIYSVFMLDYPLIWWPIEGYFLYLAFKLRDRGFDPGPLKFFLLCVFVSFVYGVFMSSTYWHWKQLVGNIMIFMMPLIAYMFSDPDKNAYVLNYWYRHAPIIILCILPFAEMSHFYGRIMQPFTLLLLFLPIIKKKYRKIALIALVLSLTLGFSDRSDNIRLTCCAILGLISCSRFKALLQSWIKRLTIVLLISPIIFFILGMTGTFNILDIGKEMGWKQNVETAAGATKDIFSDTRTGLYVEVIKSAVKNDYSVFGRSLARGYDTYFFRGLISKSLGFDYSERGASETAILNIFTYMGIVGVILAYWVFGNASIKAVFRSNNYYISLVGLYLAFRWSYCWVEEYQKFDYSYIFLWIIVGMCMSEKFRVMDDDEFKEYAAELTK